MFVPVSFYSRDLDLKDSPAGAVAFCGERKASVNRMSEQALELSTCDKRDEAPQVARMLGLGDRYRYFYGASGRRYLFSSVPVDTIGDYRNAVVVLETNADATVRDGNPWIGEIDRDGKRRGGKLQDRKLADARAYVHLLASGKSDRMAALDDLLKAYG